MSKALSNYNYLINEQGLYDEKNLRAYIETLTLGNGAGGMTPEQLTRLTNLETGLGAETTNRVNAVTALNGRIDRADGGYEFTGGFADRLTGQSGANTFGTNIEYSAADVAARRWRRFGFSEAARNANDQEYWGETDPSYDSSQGLFGGLHMPAGVSNLVDYAYDDNNLGVNSYSAEKPIVDPDNKNELRYSAATGSFNFQDARVGDLALIRFDFNVVPQIANTTLEVGLIWATRNSSNVPTFTFALTGTPQFYGTGTVSKTFLARPLITAYFASEEDVNARALLAIRADQEIQVAPLTTLVTLIR